MSDDKCATCKFFYPFDFVENGSDIGSCRRFPHQYRPENEDLLGSYGNEKPLANSPRDWSQPIVECSDWCGEFKADDRA